MAEPASPAAKAEQRAVLVARLKRAASLPRMKDGRRPPMHAEAVSESEKGHQPESSAPTTDVEDASVLDPTSAEHHHQNGRPSTADEPTTNVHHPPKDVEVQSGGFDTEGDVETEDRPFSPNPSGRSRRRRSRSRSRTSRDFKAKNRAPTPAPTGDSSPDEAPPIPVAVPIFPALLQPVPVTSNLPPQFIPYQQNMFGAVPESLFYPGTSPPTPLPLPSLEALQRGLIRSNSAGGTQASRRLALAKLTGGTETYDPSPSPTPPPLPGSGLTRNNTVAGGERFAARQLMLGRIAGRVAKETDTEQASGASGEDRGAPSPGPDKRRRRRSRRRSSAAANPAVSDSDPVSTPSQTPVPPPQFDPYSDLRAASATPNQASSSSRNHSNEHVAAAATPPPPPLPDVSVDRQGHRRRSVLIEDDEDEVRYQPQPRIPTISHTPPPPRASPHISMLRTVLQRSESPAMHSPNTMLLNGANDPSSAYFGRGSPARQVPPSPFATPLKEKDRQLSDDEEDRVIYPADTLRPRTPATNANVDLFDREISWVATPVPELRSQANDEDDDYDEYDEDVVAEVVVKDERDQYQEDGEPPLSPSSTQGYLHHDTVYDDLSPRVSTSSKSIVIESEASADVYPIRIDSSAFNMVPVSVSQSESYGQPRSPLNSEYSEWEDRSTATNELTTKRSVEANSPSTWEKMKSTFSRSGSSAGRRSRTNSILNRGDPRNSNISRESQGSLTSGGRVEKSDSLTPQTPVAPQLMHSNSASASMLSLPQHSPFRGNPSPIPPATPADMSKYQNDKLFPFPGMKKLEEQRNRDRARAFPFTSASTPDVSQLINGHEDVSASPSAHSFSPSPQSKESSRERKDSITTAANQPNEPRLGYSPVRQPGYIDLPPLAASSSTSKGKLPVTFTEVKQWLSKNKGKKSQQSQGGSTTPLAVNLPPQIELQSSTSSTKKLSLSDLLKSKDTDINSDWEDTRTPTNGPATTPSTSPSPQPHKAFSSFGYRSGRETPAAPTDTERTPKAKKVLPLTLSQSSDSRYIVEEQSTPDLAKPDRYLSPTPDPTSSVSEAPPSTSESSSTTSSRCSFGPTPEAQALLEKLDDSLLKGIAPLDEPPRKLLFSGPVLQVVDPNTVKDRFLFLFNDILIIAKPILQGKAVFNDAFSNPTDKKYMIKSVVRFRDLRFCQERAEPPPKSSVPSSIPNSPSLRAFIVQFASNPTQAVAGLSARSHGAMDSSLLAQVLFKTTELNKLRLGEYLCQKGSKNVLKAFLDNFGFTSLRIDVALRIFLHSIHLENTEAQDYTMDHVQETFAGRWYEANAKIVAFDKDMALRLVRAIIQLNELLHGSVASEVGEPSTKGRNITTRDFYEAFRRYDPRRLVPDDQLDDIYFSIRQERLMQARSPASVAAGPDIHISFMRPLPARLTYKSQSDPIIIRLPQPDPTLTLHLFGHDLTFEPPVLSFTKSPEASFRVTGNSLGTKTLVILRSGPNAIKYSGLPLSYHIPVERSFMRNTFQIAFLNHQGAKRRYMFSVDDHLMRHQWATSIRQQIEKSLATTVTPTDRALPPGVSDFYRAAEEVSFKVLQETLIQPAGSSSSNGHAVGYQHHHPPTSAEKDSHTAHRRSKSRSKVYPRQGADKLDYDVTSSSHRFNDSRDSNETDGGESTGAGAGAGAAGGGPYENGKMGGRIWSGRELELHCQQNSLIPNVLSHLQVGTGPTTS